MPKFSFLTTHPADDSRELEVTYSLSPSYPEQRYGDCPHPAEGGDVQLEAVTEAGIDIYNTLDEDDLVVIIDACQDRSGEDEAEAWADEADYRYEQRRDEQMMENWG
jgi:hypothetical protein